MPEIKIAWKELTEEERRLIREASAGSVIRPRSVRERESCERLRWYGLMLFMRDAYELTQAGYRLFLR